MDDVGIPAADLGTTDRKPEARIVVVESVYHQRFGEDPEEVQSRFSRALESNEQLYKRQLKATEEWQPLDCGWLRGNVGMLVIANTEGQFLTPNPTDEEREALSKRVIEVAYGAGIKFSWLIPPGESMRGCPSSAGSLHVRCHSETATFTLYLFPS